MTRKKRRPFGNRGVRNRSETEEKLSEKDPVKEDLREEKSEEVIKEVVKEEIREEIPEEVFEEEKAEKELTAPKEEPGEKKEPVKAETPVVRTDILRKSTETERDTLSEGKETAAGMMTDGMPEFLRSANSTIRRDGPYKNYSGNADVLRHKKREPEGTRARRAKRSKQRAKERSEGILSTETISLIALVIILGTIFFCAMKHVEMRQLSIPILLVTVIITIIMGVLLGDTPAYVTLIVVALIIIAGAVTGMLSEVLTGALFFLGTVLAIKGRFE